MSRWKMLNHLGRVLSCLVFASFLLSIEAGATGIDPGLTLVSGSGQLQFSDFTIYTEGDISDADAAGLTIAATENGLSVTGPLTLTNGEAGAIQLIYQVTVLSGPAVNGVTLAADTSIVEGGFPTFAKTDKLVYAGPIPEVLSDLALLAHIQTRNFAGRKTVAETAEFAEQTVLTVLDTIRLSSGGPGGSATLESLSNEYAFVPEPGSLLLLGGGLLGLTRLGARRTA